MTVRTAAIGPFVLLLLVAAAGCGGRTSRATAPEVDAPLPEGKTASGQRPARSDVLRVAYSDDPDTLNVITSGDSVSGEFQNLVYEPLAARGFHDPSQLEPRLAEKWEFDKDRHEYTIHLRRGVHWHPLDLPDGTPLAAAELTARDVIFTFEAILNPHVAAESLRGAFIDPTARDSSEASVIEVEAADEYTVKVRWKKPYFRSAEATLGVPIMPRHVYSVDSRGDLISLDFSSREFAEGFNNHWANTTMCGTGPLVFERWERTQRVVLARNDKYWGDPFYFSRVVFHCETNDNTLVQKLLQQKLDWADIAQTDLYFQAQRDPRVKQGNVKLEKYLYPSYHFIGYNLRRPFFSDRRVRLALTHAIPIDEIIQTVLKGLALRTTGHFLPGSPAYDKSLEPLRCDLAESRRLLDQAGWVDSDRDGVRDKQIAGRKHEARFELLLNSDVRDYVTLAEIIQANLNRLGVVMKITPMKFQVLLEKQRARNFDAIVGGWNLAWRPDPFEVWHGSQADLPGSANLAGYKNSKVDAWIDELRTASDEKREDELYHKIQRQIYEDQPYTFLFIEMQTGGLNSRIKNVKFYKIRPSIDLCEWYASDGDQH